ncbi:MAG: hypothetical protein ABI426_01470 [Flavobacterium sp.]
MKTLKLIAIGMFFLLANVMHAQVTVNVGIGAPPPWGPAGYSEVEYYYLPDVESYYEVRSEQFIYFNGNTWIRSRYLPRQYRHYDLYNGYKVVLNDYHGTRPYDNFNNHKSAYHKGYRDGVQATNGPRKVHIQHGNNGNGKKGHKR